MTGGAVANSKTYLKQTSVLNETTMCFDRLADMNYARDAHGITSWRNRFIIVVGSWHGNDSSRTCEMYDIVCNKWIMLPHLNDGTCAPGLLVIKDRYLYKLGGTSDIGKVEMLDLESPKQWVTINTCNKFGRKHTINRCLLFELPRDYSQDGIDAVRKFAPVSKQIGSNLPYIAASKLTSPQSGPQQYEQEGYLEDEGKFLVLGCHFGRSEKPFVYDILGNKYHPFSDKDTFVDMYRSNDVVQFSKKSFFIRPFVKVGEKAKSVKVFQYFFVNTNTFETDIRIQQLQKFATPPQTKVCHCNEISAFNPEEDCCARKKPQHKVAGCARCGQASMQAADREEFKQVSIFSRVANLFSKKQIPD